MPILSFIRKNDALLLTARLSLKRLLNRIFVFRKILADDWKLEAAQNTCIAFPFEQKFE
jgi:hypothetical protein